MERLLCLYNLTTFSLFFVPIISSLVNMKAVIVQSPNKLKIKEIPEPKIGDYECLCQILACSVCGGTDNHLLEGDVIHTKKYGVKYPLLLGHEGIGRIIECGKKVRNFKNGDLVTRVINKTPKNREFFAQHGRRRRVFCASLADVFDNEVQAKWRADLFALIADTFSKVIWHLVKRS